MSRAPSTRSTPAKRTRLLLISGVAATLVLLTLVGVGIYGLIARPNDNTTAPTPSNSPEPTATIPTDTTDLPRLPVTNDPIRYAEAAATALFTWDTASGLRPADYGQALLADADPSGSETAGLASDIALYFPAADAWRQLTGHATSQRLTIENASIPEAWDDAVTQDQSGTLVPGMTAVTIEGTRHRTGTDGRQQLSSDHEVAFTVFVACAPAFDRCHVLRLSAPDTPLR